MKPDHASKKPKKFRISKADAIKIVRLLWAGEGNVAVDQEWVEKIERLSALCADALGKTHIAMLGTAILAKAVRQDVDLFAFKPKHAKDVPNAYSARSLCHGVLVPLAADLGFHLGATGREPLNNQPYFRMKRLNDGTPVHERSRPAYEYMISLIEELGGIDSEKVLMGILLAFLRVRARYQVTYDLPEGEIQITPLRLAEVIREFVVADSENGKRAQAAVAGLLDVFAGPDSVESGRINDPSREYPGDVCVRALRMDEDDEEDIWLKAIEVRDKPVSMADVQIFGKRCADAGVREAAVVMVSEHQQVLSREEISAWAAGYGIGLTLFQGWLGLVEQVLYWSEAPKPVAASRAVRHIHERLIAVEATADALALWQKLTAAAADEVSVASIAKPE